MTWIHRAVGTNKIPYIVQCTKEKIFSFALLTNSFEAREGLESSKRGSIVCKVLLVLVSTNGTIPLTRPVPTRPVLSAWR